MVNDLALLHQYASSRDADAFAALVKRYAGLVYGACLRVTENAHDAEDMSQDCFMELARDAGKITSSLPAWLHLRATSRSVNSIRSASTRRRHEEVAAERRSTSVASSWSDVAPHVDQALADLDEELRTPILLHYFQGQKQSDIADGLGLNQSTVSRRIEKGIDEIRGKLKRSGVIATAGLLAALLTENAASAAPASLMITLSKMAIAGVGAGGIASGATVATGAVLSSGGTLVGSALFKVAVAIVAASIATAGWFVVQNANGNDEPKLEKIADESVPAVVVPDKLQVAPEAAPAVVAADELDKLHRSLQQKVTFELADTYFREAFRFLTALTGANIAIDKLSVKNTDDPTLTLRMSDATLEEALNMIMNMLELDYVLRNEAVFITSRGRAKAMLPPRPIVSEEELGVEWKRQANIDLQQQVSFEFAVTYFQDVFRFFDDFTGVDILIDDSCAKNLEDPTLILRMTDVSLQAALRMTTDMLALDCLLKDEAIWITTPEKATEWRKKNGNGSTQAEPAHSDSKMTAPDTFSLQARYVDVSARELKAFLEKETIAVYSHSMPQPNTSNDPTDIRLQQYHLLADLTPEQAKKIEELIRAKKLGTILGSTKQTHFSGKASLISKGDTLSSVADIQPNGEALFDGIRSRARVDEIDDTTANVSFHTLFQSLEVIEHFTLSQLDVQLPIVSSITCDYDGPITLGTTKMIIQGKPGSGDPESRFYIVLLNVERVANPKSAP